MLGAIVPRERLTDRLCRGGAPGVTIFGELLGRVVARDDRPDGPHARDPGDVRDDVVQLHVHLHERLLDVLHVGRCVVDQPLAMA